MSRLTLILTTFLLTITSSFAADPEREFSGKWQLDRGAGAPAALSVTQNDLTIECTAGPEKWIIALDGKESKYRVAGETWKSVSKWEGAALLVNTLVSGPRDYTIMDRWRLGRDHQYLTINRQIIRGTDQTESQWTYRRPGAAASEPVAESRPTETRTTEPRPANAPVLVRRPDPTIQPASAHEYVVRAGTRILLELINTVDTKRSRDGDRVYLQTAFPVVIDGRTIIPRGANVTGTVTKAKQAGKVLAKGEMYIRFDELTLPNGVTRDFRSRLGSAEGASGQVDREEGTIRGERNKSGDARTVATGAGIGATMGGVIGRSIGAAGIGGAAGAAAGLATVLLKRGPDARLPRGTQVEMILDRDLTYFADELPR